MLVYNRIILYLNMEKVNSEFYIKINFKTGELMAV